MDSTGQFHPGLGQLLHTIYLSKYIEGLKTGQDTPKAIVFCRTEDHMLKIREELKYSLPHLKDRTNMPFVMNHSGCGKVTTQNILDRRNDISLFITTTKMLLGIDITNIQIIIFVRPLNQLHYLLQGAGRAGRRKASGKKTKVLVYVLHNSSDVASTVPGMSNEVKMFCTSNTCLKVVLSKYFQIGHESDSHHGRVGGSWCCSVCDKES